MATIRKKGEGQWHVQIRRKGWPALTRTFEKKTDAEDWAIDTEAQMRRGVFVDRSPAERTTFSQIIETYLTNVTDKRPGEKSRKAERARLERFLREEPDLCAHAVAHLQPEQFEAWRDRRLTEVPSRGKPGGRGQYKEAGPPPAGRMRRDGTPRANAAKPKAPPKAAKTISAGTVKRELTLLKRVIDHSRRRLGLHLNPVSTEDVRRPVVNDERDVRLTDEQIERLLAECRASRNSWLAPAVELAFETGARRGPLLRLLWTDVDLDACGATLRGVKNSRAPEERLDQAIGLSPRALEILKALPKSTTGRVFPCSEGSVEQAWKRARRRAGVEYFRLHDARHERTSSLIEAGWSDTQVMAQLGHRDPKSLKRYANLRKQFLGEALAALPQRRKKTE